VDISPERVEHLRNPAGQLFLFLEHTRESQLHNQPIRRIWAEYLGVEEGDRRLFTRLSRVLKLPDAVRKDVEALRNPGVPKEMLLKTLPEAEGALQYVGSLDVQLHQVQAHFDRGTTSSLDFTSHFLNAHEPAFPAESVIEKIRALVEELHEEVMSAEDIDPSLARLLLDHVYRLLHALDEVALFGPTAVADESNRLAGWMVRNPQDVVAPPQTPRVWAVVKKVMVASAILSAGLSGPVHLALDAQALLGPVLELVSGFEETDTSPGTVDGVDEVEAEIVE
jgi:hypothetical protein